jgi:uncharacterized damage-inducible protein DinB
MGKTTLTEGGGKAPRVSSGMSDLAPAVVEDVRKRVVSAYPAQVRAALDSLTDEQVWARANASSNSVGNLVLHVCGSTRHFLGRGVGGTDYQRNRKQEFAERGPLPRVELLRVLDETVAEADRTLAALDPAQLLEVSTRAGEPQTVLALLLRTAHHWGIHTGQIVYAAKAMKEGVFDELWQRTMR